jgi:predicted nucleic acid-binding protein
MTLYYLDSTAWLQYYIRETDSEKIAGIFTPASVLSSASFGFMEVVIALSRLAHSGKISLEDLHHKIHDVENDWTQFLQVYSSHRVVKFAEEIAFKRNLAAERVIHLASALAVQESCQNSGADLMLTFVSADPELLEAAQQYDFIPKRPNQL